MMKFLSSLFVLLFLSGCVTLNVPEQVTVVHEPMPTVEPTVKPEPPEPIVVTQLCIPKGLVTIETTPINKADYKTIENRSEALTAYIRALEGKNKDLELIIRDYKAKRLNCYDL